MGLRRTVPLKLFGDGVACTSISKSWGKSVDAFLMASLLSSSSTKTSEVHGWLGMTTIPCFSTPFLGALSNPQRAFAHNNRIKESTILPIPWGSHWHPLEEEGHRSRHEDLGSTMGDKVASHKSTLYPPTKGFVVKGCVRILILLLYVWGS